MEKARELSESTYWNKVVGKNHISAVCCRYKSAFWEVAKKVSEKLGLKKWARSNSSFVTFFKFYFVLASIFHF